MKTAHYQSPFGCLKITASTKGITSLRLQQGGDCYGAKIPEELAEAAQQLDEYFHKKRKAFDLKLDISSGTPFNQSVWKELMKIPFGRTTSYSAIAKSINNPAAVRAVGLANRNNPIAIIIPCHRVIAKSGDLQGYFYGLDMKRKLLELENPMSYGEQGSLF
ncbi:MAG TPA: methylated-DNA--[protein]-cysteine S-methyltransferase [Bacteroidetes bacterium]|nr:methylated-DNA--[protein]-cysteine S-methyltransferase [Bacteroidota bacterium]